VGNIDLALKYGLEYLEIIIIGLIPFAIGQAYTNTIRECGQTFIPMIASVFAVVLNVILDAILIFGLLGAPKLGVKGAAIATFIARFVECIVVIVWAHIRKEKNRYIVGAYKSIVIPKDILKNIFIKGTPLMVNEILWAVGMAVVVQCYAVRGLEVVAALNIASTITNLFNIVYIQLGACIAIVAGQLLGANKIEKAKDSVNKMLFFCVACCVLVSIIMILLGGVFPNIYKTEVIIKKMATKFIILAAAAMPICAYSHGAYFTLRSGGKTIITFLFDSVYTWILLIPVAFVLSRYSNLNIITVFAIVQFMEIIKATIGYFMVKSGIWINNIVQ
ncbi:MAG: polysaccharide biosynthesis C-terminal domain-containing protein, partial [Clostridia bacterium]|nr:polysaccharide biosynthesis C-terminal domain-containing protein [Clostridia bacterium]